MGSVLTNGGKCETEIGKHIEIVKDFQKVSNILIDREISLETKSVELLCIIGPP